MIDVNAKDFKLADVSLQMLIADAVDRGDKEALDWLKENATAKVMRRIDKNKDLGEDNQIEVNKPITMYRTEYLTKYCGYTVKKYAPSEEAKQRMKARAKARAAEKRNKMFDDAFAKLG